MREVIDVINEKNEVINTVEYEEIYEKKLSHRIAHIFVINSDTNEIYFQKRAETKSFLPGYYCTSAGGHVSAGESYLEAAKRELYEEIGLKTTLDKIGSFVFESDDHKRYIELFLTYANDGFSFNDGEVASGEFLSLEKAQELINADVKIHPQLKACFEYYIDNK